MSKSVNSIYELIKHVEIDDRIQDQYGNMYTVIRVTEEDMSGPKVITVVSECWNTSSHVSYSDAVVPIFVKVFSQHATLFRRSLSPTIFGDVKAVLTKPGINYA